MSNNRGWVVLVVIQPMQKFYIDYLISITNYRQNALQHSSLLKTSAVKQ